MTTPAALTEAKATLRAYADGSSTKPVRTAAGIVLEHAENMEIRARKLYEKADPGERRDAVLENIRSTCRYILGEGSSVGLAKRLIERNAP